MNEAENLLLDSLNLRKPILFVGAGFSFGALCKGKPLLLGNSLKDKLFKIFYEDNCPSTVTELDKQEIKADTLAGICKSIQNDGRKKQLYEVLIDLFKGSKSNPLDPFHNLICDYYWDKIYTINIDDLIENIYLEHNIDFEVQNEIICKPYETKRQIIKLHGCVNNPQAGFIFSSDEYSANISTEDYRLKEFGQDFFANDIIFLGTEFNESDLQVILDKYRKSGFVSNNCRYFFVSPKIGYNLRNIISSTPNYYYINWNAKQFLTICSTLGKQNKSIEVQERLLEQNGNFLKVNKYTDVPSSYESKLYYGNKVTFYDIFSNWDIENSKLDGVCKKVIRESQHSGYVIAIYGKAYSGKTVIATRLLVELFKHGYEAFSYNCDGEDELNQLAEYFIQCPSLKKVAVLIDDAAYLYGSISKIILTLPAHLESVIFVLVSDEKKHNSQKHELICVNGREWKVNDQFDDKLPTRVYRKLSEKHRLGNLTQYRNERTAIAKIAESKYLTEFLFNLTQGQGFKDYFRNRMNDFLTNSSTENIEIFKSLCIFTKLGIHNVSQGLLLLLYPHIQKEQFTDLLIGIDSTGSVSLRCADAYDNFLFSLSSSERADHVYKALTSIANMFREDANNRWKNVFEQLLKSRSLFHDLKIDKNNLAALFAKLEKYYHSVSYFWLQRGIFKQNIGEYDEAHNFLNQALSIRPNSYQIRHAIAKNRLEQSIYLISTKRKAEAYSFYDAGLHELEDLIESPRFSRNIGHSVHSYISTTIKFYRKANQIISKEQIIEMHKILIQSSKQSYDQWMNNCRRDLYFYCEAYVPDLKKMFDPSEFEKYKSTNYIKKM